MFPQTNKYCSLANLHNESDVEQFFMAKLLEDLGYTPDYVQTSQVDPIIRTAVRLK